jgi:hypothetical protein
MSYFEIKPNKDESVSLQLLEDILEDFYKSLRHLRNRTK